MELMPGDFGCVGFFWVKIRPYYAGRPAQSLSMGCMHFGIPRLHFLLCRAHPPPIGQFWPWVSISDERFHGKRMTFMSKVELVISFGDYLLIISASPLPHCCWQSRLSSYYLLKELKRKRPRLTPNNWKETTCLRTSKCQLMELASRLEDFYL